VLVLAPGRAAAGLAGCSGQHPGGQGEQLIQGTGVQTHQTGIEHGEGVHQRGHGLVLPNSRADGNGAVILADQSFLPCMTFVSVRSRASTSTGLER